MQSAVNMIPYGVRWFFLNIVIVRRSVNSQTIEDRVLLEGLETAQVGHTVHVHVHFYGTSKWVQS